uniref:Uncharacterized protein n=1 Tax=Anguilla anguilla TaxID=7936 RepID=A0A0E9WD28_ANGAN
MSSACRKASGVKMSWTKDGLLHRLTLCA